MINSLVRSIGTAVVVVGCAMAIPTVAAAQTPQKPASLAGTWNMGLIGDHVIPVALVLEQDGTALKGTFIFMGKDFPVTGETKNGTFTLSGKGPSFGRPNVDHGGAGAGPATATATVKGPQQPGVPGMVVQTADMTIVGTTKDDGTLAGDMNTKLDDGRTGKITWTAERLKERKVTNEPAMSSANVDVTGKWTMAVVEAQIQMALDMKQVGSKVTGTASSDHLGTMTLDGTLANGMLMFVATGSNAGQDVRLEFSGKLKADNTFAGDLTSPMGSMTWTLARVKK